MQDSYCLHLVVEAMDSPVRRECQHELALATASSLIGRDPGEVDAPRITDVWILADD